MDRITSISVKNIKGIKSKTFGFEISPNRPNVFVAPNGFGKSSLAAGFQALKASRLDLPEDQYHNGDLKNPPELQLSYLDGGQPRNAVANKNKNQLAAITSTDVISCAIVAKGTSQQLGGFTSTTAKMVVPDITLYATIPSSTSFEYKLTDMRKGFGNGAKALPNISGLLSDDQLVEALWSKRALWASNLLVKASTIDNEHTEFLKHHDGSRKQIVDDGASEWCKKLEGIKQYKAIVGVFESVKGMDSTSYDCWLSAVQLYKFYSKDKERFKQAVQWLLYKKHKRFCKELFDQMSSGWKGVQLTEKAYGGNKNKKKKLLIKFPRLDSISNGQRDILIFIANMLKFETKSTSSNAILIIDEVFDYLDDANLLAVQYYITKLIDEYKRTGRNIYPIILTHLNPNYFKTFVFSKMKVFYLRQSPDNTNQHLKKLMKVRDDKNESEDLRDDISKFLFHYHIGEINRRDDFRRRGMKELWGEGEHFDRYIDTEMGNYLSPDNLDNYEPFAICCALRKQIEKQCYEMIESQDLKLEYLDARTTKKKMNFARSEAFVDIPEIFYLLSSLYNDSLHWKDDRDMVTPLACKLENLTIKKMVSEVMAM